VNADCRASNHRALCICRTGFIGDPYTVCEERKYLEFGLGINCNYNIFKYNAWNLFFLLPSWLQKRFRMSTHSDLYQQRMCRPMSVWKVWHKCTMLSQKSSCCLHMSVRLQARSRPIHSLQAIWVSHWSGLCQHSSMCQWEMCQSLSVCQKCWLLC